MKIRILVISLFAVLLPAVATFAQEVSIEPILTENCKQAQSYLNITLKKRDLHARVDRLQAYRYIYQRLDSFVNRLEKNNQPGAQDLRTDLSVLNTKIENFKNDYETYDASRDLVANMTQCLSKKSEFEKNIIVMQANRAAVNTDVSSIRVLLEDTIKGRLDTLYQQYLETGTNGDGLNE